MSSATEVSCTNLPTIDVVAEVERELGRPVVSASLATVWAALQAAGIAATPRREQLFRTEPLRR